MKENKKVAAWLLGWAVLVGIPLQIDNLRRISCHEDAGGCQEDRGETGGKSHERIPLHTASSMTSVGFMRMSGR